MTAEPGWLTLEDIVYLHDRQIRRFGGLPGVRDINAIESATARPRQKAAYETPDLADLAAAYDGFWLAKKHGFSDGNKRVALNAILVLLDINGQQLTASEPDAVATMIGVASGDLTEDELAMWIRRSVAPRGEKMRA